jgi:hypothetical protein
MDTTKNPLTCHRCGCPHVAWMRTNAGKWYLAVRFDTVNSSAPDRAYASAARKRPHTCGCRQYPCSDRI